MASEAEATRCFPVETGGAFMGSSSLIGEYLIEHMIGPGPFADHRPSSFKPDGEWQWSEMRRLHAEDLSIQFLGDWHTHPLSSSGRLSKTDLTALAEILTDKKSKANSVLSIIISGRPSRWKWCAWEAIFDKVNGRDSTITVRLIDIRQTA